MQDFFGATYFETGPVWRSEFLSTASVRSQANPSIAIRSLFDDLLSKKSVLWKEASGALIKAVEEDDSWLADIARAQELFTYGASFQASMKQIERWLPESGRILEVGGGTGWSAALFARRSAQRQLVFVERYHQRVLAEKRFKDLLPEGRRPWILPAEPGLHMNLKPRSYDAMVTHSFFNSQLEEDWEENFKQYFDALKSGGRLVVAEPIRKRESVYLNYLLESAIEGVEGGAPQNDFQLVFLLASLSGKLFEKISGEKSKLQFVSSSLLQEAAYEAGFNLVKKANLHDSVHSYFVFEKP